MRSVTRPWERSSFPVCTAPGTFRAPVNCRPPVQQPAPLGREPCPPKDGWRRRGSPQLCNTDWWAPWLTDAHCLCGHSYKPHRRWRQPPGNSWETFRGTPTDGCFSFTKYSGSVGGSVTGYFIQCYQGGPP